MKSLRLSLILLTVGAVATLASAQSVNDAALQGIKVTSGRSYAMMQFNMVAVRLWLPRVPNSAYASEEFGRPKLVDAKGKPVAHEVEQGIYDHDKWETEIRFETKGEPARMSGTIHVHYPVRVRPPVKSDSPKALTEPATFVKLPSVFVEQWKDVEITYDLPVIAKLPESQNGSTPELPKTIADTPGGKVGVTVKK